MSPKRKVKEKTVTVKLSELTRLCHSCGKVSETVHLRTYRSKNYEGPCGDSFCYASCDLSACRMTRAQVCDPCAEKGELPRS